MSAFSDYLENALLNHVLRGEIYTPADNLYVSLHTEVVGDAGLGQEISGASYERKQVTFTLSTNSSSDNEEPIIWTNMPEATVVAVGIWDNSNDPDPGNLLFHGPLLEPRSLSAGDPFVFNTGDLDIILD